jgi:hypothetical protein
VISAIVGNVYCMVSGVLKYYNFQFNSSLYKKVIYFGFSTF